MCHSKVSIEHLYERPFLFPWYARILNCYMFVVGTQNQLYRIESHMVQTLVNCPGSYVLITTLSLCTVLALGRFTPLGLVQ